MNILGNRIFKNIYVLKGLDKLCIILRSSDICIPTDGVYTVVAWYNSKSLPNVFHIFFLSTTDLTETTESDSYVHYILFSVHTVACDCQSDVQVL